MIGNTDSVYTDPLIQHFSNKVLDVLRNAGQVSGLDDPLLNELRSNIETCWNELVEKGVIEVTDTDSAVRPNYVAIQAIMEHVLSQEIGKSIKDVDGYILTPMPSTPLCTKGEISKEPVSPEIEQDPKRRLTVEARAIILRKLLHQGGKLSVWYAKNGYDSRTPEQQNIFRDALKEYAGHLRAYSLDREAIDPESIGAFYIFTSNDRKTYGFAIKMTQAKNPQEQGSYGLWFGEYKEGTPVFDRISKCRAM